MVTTRSAAALVATRDAASRFGRLSDDVIRHIVDQLDQSHVGRAERTCSLLMSTFREQRTKLILPKDGNMMVFGFRVIRPHFLCAETQAENHGIIALLLRYPATEHIDATALDAETLWKLFVSIGADRDGGWCDLSCSLKSITVSPARACTTERIRWLVEHEGILVEPRLPLDVYAFLAAAATYAPGDCAITVHADDLSNKAHYFDVTVETPGGTAFRIKWRAAGQGVMEDDACDAFMDEHPEWEDVAYEHPEYEAFAQARAEAIAKGWTDDLKERPFDTLLGVLEEVGGEEFDETNFIKMVTRGEDLHADEDGALPYFEPEEYGES
jgi:hypothetical protein